MKNQINKLLEIIKADYAAYQMMCNWNGTPNPELSDVQKKMRKEFNESLHYVEGKKYIKILKEGSVWGFVVNVDDDKKFRKGDILKAASYNTPARNKPRGNVLDNDFLMVRWTGPAYLSGM